MVLKEKDVESIAVISKGYNPHTNATVLVKIKGRTGFYVQSYKGWNIIYTPISEAEAVELKARHDKEKQGKEAIYWLRDNIVLSNIKGVYVRPSIVVVARKLLVNQSRTWTDMQQKTCYDCNGPSWSHSSWEEWRGSGEWSIKPALVNKMKEKLDIYRSISKELDW